MSNNSQPLKPVTKKTTAKKQLFSGTVQAKVAELAEHPKNPRIIKDKNYTALVKSLKDFPEMLEARPLVVVTNPEASEENPVKYHVIGGNMRLRVAREIAMETLPIVVVDHWTEEMRKEFMIKDNINYGEWDLAALVTDWNGKELENWGLDNVNWNPVVDPSFNNNKVTDNDINKKANELKIKMRNVQSFVDCICPNCGHEFQLSSGDVPQGNKPGPDQNEKA